ncbi:MAG: FAD-dependent monooxygenase [Paracoccaceae bacterium]
MPRNRDLAPGAVGRQIGRVRTQAAIIGPGPAGRFLGQLRHRAGIENAIPERATQDHVPGRVRAGVPEEGTVRLAEKAGAAARLRREGLRRGAIEIAFGGEHDCVDLMRLTGGRRVTVYSQTEITADLMAAREAAGLPTAYQAAAVQPEGFDRAAGDVHYLFDALRKHCDEGLRAGHGGPSARALSRVWKPVRFSWSMTAMLRRFPDTGAFGPRIQTTEPEYLTGSGLAAGALAENCGGLAF